MNADIWPQSLHFKHLPNIEKKIQKAIKYIFSSSSCDSEEKWDSNVCTTLQNTSAPYLPRVQLTDHKWSNTGATECGWNWYYVLLSYFLCLPLAFPALSFILHFDPLCFLYLTLSCPAASGFLVLTPCCPAEPHSSVSEKAQLSSACVYVTKLFM